MACFSVMKVCDCFAFFLIHYYSFRINLANYMFFLFLLIFPFFVCFNVCANPLNFLFSQGRYISWAYIAWGSNIWSCFWRAVDWTGMFYSVEAFKCQAQNFNFHWRIKQQKKLAHKKIVSLWQTFQLTQKSNSKASSIVWFLGCFKRKT